MKKITYLLTGLFLFVATAGVKAQSSQDCTVKYGLFSGNYKTKNYAEAKPQLLELLEKCPKLSVSVYQYGSKIAAKDKDHALMKRLYEMRLENFPNKGAAKAHSDYAKYLAKNKLGTDDEIFSILEKAYKISPKDMSVKNIYVYFQGVTDRFKDSDTQKVFDTYDDVMESIEEKLDDYRKKIGALQKQEEAGHLGAKGKKNLNAFTKNSALLGKVEGGLDNIISEIATCPRLIPIYTRDYEANKTNGTWLKRAVSRMYNKGCQSDPLYEKLARSYADVTQSADAFNFVAGVLSKKGDEAGAAQMREKAFNLETDPIKKAKLKLRAAQNAKDAGRKAEARRLALEALTYNPNYGKAYLLIAHLYAKSANSCGKNEFEKRMVYAAALKMARKAQSVDPSSNAGRYISSYRGQLPSKKLIFSEGVQPGSSHRVGCWIGETVRVPNN